ncbi:hypothetical protein IAT38_004061 [Cryptococcus sp. DSM 104549]
MVDCGPSATWKLSKAGLNPKNVDKLFLTHHHFDHNVDTPCLLLTRWDQSGESGKPIHVYGPQPTVDFCEKLVGPEGAYQPDWFARTKWQPSLNIYRVRGGKLPRLPPNVQAEDIEVGWTMKTDNYTVTAGYAAHAQPYLDCVAYRFDTPEGSFVFSGDTGLCDEISELAKGADYLFCMASGWDMGDFATANNDHARKCIPGVSDEQDAGLMAERAGVKKLVLVHTGPGQSKEPRRERSIEAARSQFKGEIIFGDEITSFTL